MDPVLDNFFVDFWASSGSISGPILESKWAKKRQHRPKKVLKSLKVPKSSICKKCDFPIGKPYFSSLGGSQDEHKTLKKALKRNLKSFKTRNKRVPKIDLHKSMCWSSFGADLGPKMDPKIDK